MNAKERRKERRRAEHETNADGATPGGEVKSPVVVFELELVAVFCLFAAALREINVKSQ